VSLDNGTDVLELSPQGYRVMHSLGRDMREHVALWTQVSTLRSVGRLSRGLEDKLPPNGRTWAGLSDARVRVRCLFTNF
jgi:hypothetical protein